MKSLIPYIIWGAGGHACSIFEVLRIRKDCVVQCFVDDFSEQIEVREISGIKVLRKVPSEPGNFKFIVGIGANEPRRRIASNLRNAYGIGAVPPVFAENVQLGFASKVGSGTFCANQVFINCRVEIGEDVILNTRALIEHDCTIEDGAFIGPGCIICGGVTVGRGAFVGAGAVIRDKVRVGEYAVVGCGAVIVKDVPPKSKIVGNPAIPISASLN